jgi:adenine-specific DNA-methyltransferase
VSKITAYNHTPPHKRAHIPSKEEAGMEGQQLSTVHYPLNPVTHRGQDPELWWLDKYGKDDREETLDLAVQSVYRHEHVSPQVLIDALVKVKDGGGAQASIWDTFGNTLKMDELDKVADYYKHSADWQNRLIQGDSLLVMTSLLEREGMAGKVQTIYIDPPYGIKYGSNWQLRLNNRDVKDGSDDALSGEPEMIKAFRDTWELGIHSYLSYLRDRLLIAKELLTESGSCFVQISDENVHLVRCLMDEVFGSENFVSLITFKKTAGLGTDGIASVSDYIIWYSKNKETAKIRTIYVPQDFSNDPNYVWVMNDSGEKRRLTKEEKAAGKIPEGWKLFRHQIYLAAGLTPSCVYPLEFKGETFLPTANRSWSTNKEGTARLIKKNRLSKNGSTVNYVRYADDFPINPLSNFWADGASGVGMDKQYVVQTNEKIIQRCILMTTDPGDLVLDPTCGSGTTAYVAEQWGRRWITIDTSRIALNIAKTRLMTATFPYYYLHADVLVEREEKGGKIKKKILENPNAEHKGETQHGFVYEEVPHITLKSLANDEPADTETLYDKPYVDKSRIRVAGPFTVETLQNFEPMTVDSGQGIVDSGEQLTTNHTSLTTKNSLTTDHYSLFRDTIFTRLQSSGINNGDKTQHARFLRVEPLPGGVYLHGQGYYETEKGEALAYIHLGPKFGTVSKEAVNEAIKECRARGGADWLIIMGFSFESNIESGTTQTTSLGSFRVTKCRLHDDFLQEGLKKKPAANSGSFVTIGEPDIAVLKEGHSARIEIRGLDIYDPIRDDVQARNVSDIAYWMLDDDYDGSNFMVKQVFFCGGDKDEFDDFKKGISVLAKESAKAKVQRLLKIELDEEAFDRLYGYVSHPIEVRKGRKVAVRVISQFGEESTKVVTL